MSSEEIMSEPIIQVNNLSKQYHIGARERINRTFREAFVDALTSPVRNFRQLRNLTKFENAENEVQGTELKDSSALCPSIAVPMPSSPGDTIWALKDVSFEVQPGEVIGIIGRNGAGKSTLLKILSRITEPTSGEVMLHGRVASLLEVGTGFHPELTGRENIYLNGTILGMQKTEIDRKFDEIVAFSEIEKFLDTPVKRYSSGMYVRLAFAVAAHLEPEILLVDEVLAVGDAAFQKKCLGKMGDVAKEGRTVLFVSHNMAAILNLCHKAIVLEGGRVSFSGDIHEAIDHYLFKFRKDNLFLSQPGRKHIQPRTFIQDFEILPNPPRTGHPLDFIFHVHDTSNGNECSLIDLAVSIKTQHGVPLFQLYSQHMGRHFALTKRLEKIFTHIESLPLAPGRYVVNLWMGRGKEVIDFIPDAMVLNVESGALNRVDYVESTGYPVVMSSKWKQQVS